METRGNTMCQIAIMQVAPEEAETMNRLSTIWAMTMNKSHKNVLLYPIDIQVDDVEELWPRKYIDTSMFNEFTCEDGSEWLVSQDVSIDDINAFFTLYLHEEEMVA